MLEGGGVRDGAGGGVVGGGGGGVEASSSPSSPSSSSHFLRGSAKHFALLTILDTRGGSESGGGRRGRSGSASASLRYMGNLMCPADSFGFDVFLWGFHGSRTGWLGFEEFVVFK